MFQRGEAAAGPSAANLYLAFQANAPQGFVDLFAGYVRIGRLGRAARRIINKVRGISRVVYGITAKPAGSIE
jgi:GMP synthase C terminal domain